MPRGVDHLKARASGLVRPLGFRVIILIVAFAVLAAVYIKHLFTLQIVRGEEYLNTFQLRIKREVSIPSTRGRIYDRNGKILAANDLAYAVAIRDTYEESGRNTRLNSTINRVLDIIERNGDSITATFGIGMGENGYIYTLDGASRLRFIADIYGRTSADDLTYEEKTKTPDDIIRDLAERYQLGQKTASEDGDGQVFVIDSSYSAQRLLDIITIRYRLSLNAYQKYLTTTIAFNVSGQTVADILENADVLQGISVENETIRRYPDGKYFSQILGYTGIISTDELNTLKKTDPEYDSTDTVGKAGIESSLESELQGRKGSMTVYLDSLGKILETVGVTSPRAGNDVYLTIDRDLQVAVYDILEKKLADILLARIENIKEYTPKPNENSSIVIPIYDVYNAVFSNGIVSIPHMGGPEAGETEQAVYARFAERLDGVIQEINDEISTRRVPYKDLPKEMQVYQSYIVQYLYDNEVIPRSLVDTDDDVYIRWTTEETIPLAEYLEHTVASGWVNMSKLDLNEKYSGAAEVMSAISRYISEHLREDDGFRRRVIRFMIQNDLLSGEEVCLILMEQGIVDVPEEEKGLFLSGNETAYTFMRTRIQKLDLTPADLSLDPCTGSVVITDVNTGEVLALVTYPSYDSNLMANGVDAEYFNRLLNDHSRPLINYATQQWTAPGSTFKMVSSTAALLEGVITDEEKITCTATYTEISPSPHCWIYPKGAHGPLNVTEAIHNSCNYFFFEVGHRLGMDESGVYHSELGIEKLYRYADMYGLTETSGIEIEEASPRVSDMDAVRSAIGQGSSGYTTVQLARYVSAVANSGTCFNLTLIDRIQDTDGQLLSDNEASVRNVIDMDEEYWDHIHTGMREVVEDKAYFSDFPIAVAGKTGTAQETEGRANHALFVCYAPYEKPEISVVTRIANGYTSDYAAQTTLEILRYYFGLADRDSIVSDDTSEMTGTIGGD